MEDPNYPGMMEEDEAEPSTTEEKEKGKGAAEPDENTALLPKSFFEGQDIKPGEQYYVEIVRSYEDEVEVKYPHKVKEESEEESSEDKISAMGREVGGGY